MTPQALTPRALIPQQPPAVAVLAGGRGSRLGGVLKAALRYRGSPLLSRLLADVWAASPSSAEHTVLVGDPAELKPLTSSLAGAGRVQWAREDPPFSGPVAALAAALGQLDREFVLLLASDLPEVSEGVQTLLDAPRGPDGVLLHDAAGKDQFLFGLYRSAGLRAAIEAATAGAGPETRRPSSEAGIGATVPPPGQSGPRMAAVIARLELVRVRAPGRSAEDIDHWSAARRWGISKGR